MKIAFLLIASLFSSVASSEEESPDYILSSSLFKSQNYSLQGKPEKIWKGISEKGVGFESYKFTNDILTASYFVKEDNGLVVKNLMVNKIPQGEVGNARIVATKDAWIQVWYDDVSEAIHSLKIDQASGGLEISKIPHKREVFYFGSGMGDALMIAYAGEGNFFYFNGEDSKKVHSISYAGIIANSPSYVNIDDSSIEAVVCVRSKTNEGKIDYANFEVWGIFADKNGKIMSSRKLGKSKMPHYGPPRGAFTRRLDGENDILVLGKSPVAETDVDEVVFKMD